MSTPNLDAIRARRDAATRGPWRVLPPEALEALKKVAPEHFGHCSIVIERPPQSREEAYETFLHVILAGCVTPADAEFIANARADVDFLLKEIERLRMLVE